MLTAEELKKYIDLAYSAHQEHNKTERGQYRQHGQVPYLEHLLWASMMLLADRKVPAHEREMGAKALLLHDVLEDTHLELPHWVDPEVKDLVKQMTFMTWEETKAAIPNRTPFVKLLILYDKLMTLYEYSVSEGKRKEWKELCSELIKEAERNYGSDLRVVQVGKTLVQHTDW